jgi:hypothetical protein
VSTLFAQIIIDISLSRSDFYTNIFHTNSRVVIFTILGLAYIIGQSVFLEFIGKKNEEITNKRQLSLPIIIRPVMIVQYVLTAIIICFVLQIVLTSSYNVHLLALAIGVSYTLSIALSGLLSKRFFSWFVSNKNLVVFLYCLSSGMLAINAVCALTFVDTVLLSLSQPYVYPHAIGIFVPFITSGLSTIVLNFVYSVSSMLSFMLSWVATILVMRHYSPKLGKVKFWIVLSFPLGYFLIQFLPLFPNLVQLISESSEILFLYSLIPQYSKVAGAVLFGLAFWIIARNLAKTSALRDYMIMSAYGFALVFASNQAILLIDSPYPPFGLITTAFMGIASYLVLIGIYSSAISIAQDSKLRQYIRKSAVESKLLDSIGTAEMEREIQHRVIELTKRNQDHMVEDSGVVSSLTEDDLKAYLNQVVNELHKDQNEKS